MLLYFVLFGGSPGIWLPDDYLLQFQLCLRSLIKTTPILPDLLIICDPPKAEQLRRLELLEAFKSELYVVPFVDIYSFMCKRFDIFDVMERAGISERKVMYVDTDTVFVKCPEKLFDAIREDGVLYAKSEEQFDRSQWISFFCLRCEVPLPGGPPYLNSGHFGFVTGPKTRGMFSEFNRAIPALYPLSVYLDQPILNSFFRRRHMKTPCVDTEAFSDLIKLEQGDPDVGEAVLIHFIYSDKLRRMEAAFNKIP